MTRPLTVAAYDGDTDTLYLVTAASASADDGTATATVDAAEIIIVRRADGTLLSLTVPFSRRRGADLAAHLAPYGTIDPAALDAAISAES